LSERSCDDENNHEKCGIPGVRGWHISAVSLNHEGKSYRWRPKKRKWVPLTETRRNVYAARQHVPLSHVTAQNIYDVFAYCNVGGKMRCVRQVPASIDPKAVTLEFMSPAEFKQAFVNRVVYEAVEFQVIDRDAPRIEGEAPPTRAELKIVKRTLANQFLSNKHRVTYDRMVFEADPKRVNEADYNTWTGFTIQPAPGDWRLMEAMIFESLANGDKEAFDYIKRWVAWCFQNPTKRAEACLVLRSEKQGTGKGMLGNSIGRVFGTHAVHLFRQNALTARFNSQLACCAFLFDDESTFSGDLAAASQMKGLITEPTIDIERKGIDVITLPNSLKILKATNNAWAAPVEANDRRYAIIESSDAYANDQKYFRPIIRELARGGRSAMLHDLLNFDLKGWHPRSDLPANPAKAEQQVLSLPAEQQWLLGLLTEGRLPYCDDRNPNRCISPSGLYEHARRSSPQLRYWTDVRFSKFLDSWGTQTRRSNGLYRDFGSLQDFRRRWCDRFYWCKDFEKLPADQEWIGENWGAELDRVDRLDIKPVRRFFLPDQRLDNLDRLDSFFFIGK
jgi:hypothetical protein